MPTHIATCIILQLPTPRRIHCAVDNIMECSQRHCLHRNRTILSVKTYLRHWLYVPNLFIVPSPTAVDKRAQTDLCASLGIHFRIVNSRTRWRCYFTVKGSHSMKDRRIFIKISAPHTLMTTFRMSLISTGSISRGKTFKKISARTSINTRKSRVTNLLTVFTSCTCYCKK